ncbi:hypothetical protein SAMN05192541_14638 [Bradyrhizobium arachidis]|nr:hypothetical protein SAMN05192541_14638 [Bradyrhizobium arachidis]
MPFIVSNALFDYWWTPDAACAASLRATAVTCSRAVGRAFCGGSNRERTRYGEDFRPPQPVCRRTGKGSRLGRRKKAGTFDPEKFEDHYESALLELINEKRAGKVIRPKERPPACYVLARRGHSLGGSLARSDGEGAAAVPVCGVPCRPLGRPPALDPRVLLAIPRKLKTFQTSLARERLRAVLRKARE